MKYQNIIFLENATNQLSKYEAKNLVQINDDAFGTYDPNSQIRFKTLILTSMLYDYSDAYILVTGTIKDASQAGINQNDIGKE